MIHIIRYLKKKVSMQKKLQIDSKWSEICKKKEKKHVTGDAKYYNEFGWDKSN